MTEEQKKYYNAMKKLGSKKPQKPIPRPLVGTLGRHTLLLFGKNTLGPLQREKRLAAGAACCSFPRCYSGS